MNKYIIYIFTIILAASLQSCNGFLDITPDGQIKRTELLESEEGYESALYGAYAQLRSSSLYGQEMMYNTLECLAQEFDCYGNNTVTALNEYDWTYSGVETILTNIWTAMYANISNVNSVLNSDLMENPTEFPYTIYKGEALALRAFMHFDLVRLFRQQYTLHPEAQGIPYVTRFSLEITDFESEKANYDHIIADLLEAERLLADEVNHKDETDFMRDRQIHINYYAVQALLARVYLTMGDKENALTYARKVINGQSTYTLKEKSEVLGDMAGVLSRKECLFGVYYANWYDQVVSKLYQTVSFSSLNPRDDVETIFNDDAYRSYATFGTIEQGGESVLRFTKFIDTYIQQGNTAARPSDMIQGINLIRLPEMYYIAAECLLESDYSQAVDLINTVLNHRGVQTLDKNAEQKELTIDYLCKERRKEFFGEGQTYFNCKRLNRSILSVDGSITYNPSSTDMYPSLDVNDEIDYRY